MSANGESRLLRGIAANVETPEEVLRRIVNGEEFEKRVRMIAERTLERLNAEQYVPPKSDRAGG